MNSGEVAIVVEQNRERRLRPKVMVVLDEARQPVAATRTIDLAKLPSDQNHKRARWIVHGHETGAFGIDPENYFR